MRLVTMSRLRGSGDAGSEHCFIFLDMLKNVFQDLLSISMMHLVDILTREDGDWLKMMLFSCFHHNPDSRLKCDWSEEQDMNVKLSSHQNNLNVISSLAITFTHQQSPQLRTMLMKIQFKNQHTEAGSRRVALKTFFNADVDRILSCFVSEWVDAKCWYLRSL